MTQIKASNIASLTSAQLATIVSDETGSGTLVFATNPVLVTPNLGTPSTLVGTNITGTASTLNIGGNAATATNVTGSIASAVTGTTQTPLTGGTKIATCGYADASVSANSLPVNSIRQTVLVGNGAQSGTPTNIVSGSGLALNLVATAVNTILTAATGFTAKGNSDVMEVLSADTTGIITLPANNLSYLNRDLTVGWNSTLAAPQTGYTYNQAFQSSLTLNNIGTDDFGNTWANTGVTFANTTPKYSGTYYGVFNGTTSKIIQSNLQVFNPTGWTIRCGFYSTSIGTNQVIFTYSVGASTYGIQFQVVSSKITLYLSSTGGSWDMTAALAGTNTLLSNTWYDVELTYDSISGKYYTYVNGVADSALTVTSALKICAGANATVGASAGSSQYFIGNIQGFEYKPYCSHPAGSSFTPQTALAVIGTSSYAADWTSVGEAKTYSINTASTVAGQNPTFTQKTRVYLSQITTAASSISSIVNYPYGTTPFQQGLGYGQTWQAVTLSRSFGITYYNTTAKPIMLLVTYPAGNGGNAIVNGITISLNVGYSVSLPQCSCIVPPSNSYSMTTNGGTPYIWAELR